MQSLRNRKKASVPGVVSEKLGENTVGGSGTRTGIHTHTYMRVPLRITQRVDLMKNR